MVRRSLVIAIAARKEKRRRLKTKRRLVRRRRRQTVKAIQDSENWVAPEINQDLLTEILARLPAKSVMRFKCISKFLLSLFSSRDFCNRFITLPTSQSFGLYMSLLDHENYSKSLLLSSAPSTCPSSLEFDHDLTIRKMRGWYLRAVRGFLCFTVFKKARVYNPSTRQLVILPAVVESNVIAEEDVYKIFYFICYDPVNDQYKLLCSITQVSDNMLLEIRSELWVFVLEAGGSWKRVAKDFPCHLPDGLELNMNGVLYYLAWTDLHTSCVLVRFDIRSEELDMLQVPRKAGDVLTRLD
ncbi:hypothetical protein EUTSA_v10023110mg, partial [Eutrema salsugineum]